MYATKLKARLACTHHTTVWALTASAAVMPRPENASATTLPERAEHAEPRHVLAEDPQARQNISGDENGQEQP